MQAIPLIIRSTYIILNVPYSLIPEQEITPKKLLERHIEAKKVVTFFVIQVIICRYTFLHMCDFATSASTDSFGSRYNGQRVRNEPRGG
jgi:heme/copper-type cytochrome/quinol oxidase subunit 4